MQFAAVHESLVGTFETCRRAPRMSGVGGRPEVIGIGAFDPKPTLVSRCAHVSATRSGPLADLDDGGFRHRSARRTVRPIDLLNALSGFCSCAAAQSQPARFSR